MLQVTLIPALLDNYIFVLSRYETDDVVVVDPAQAGLVLAWLQENKKNLAAILNTHHHVDHVGGNRELQQKTHCPIIGFAGDHQRLPGLTRLVKHGDYVDILGYEAMVIEMPGHTSGHIGYFIAEQGILFVGDTLFSIGCGRLFEGTPPIMWASLEKLLALPDETRVYCAHEYTLDNILFAESLMTSKDPELEVYKSLCLKKRAQNLPTVPTSLKLEKRLNPFLAVANQAYREQIHLGHQTAQEAFATLRMRKDTFTG